MIDQYLADQAAGLNVAKTNGSPPIITIPVVVHVVYRTAVENISNAQAISQVQVLNDDFAKLNADAIKVTQPTFSTVASGAQIRFCLAQRDPLGNPTTGVARYTTTVTSFNTNDNVKNAATGGATAWDVTKYVNIWVCNLGTSLLGYGEFPTGTLSNTWGLVLNYRYTGSGGSAQAPFNLGRTGTHEFGHCFNLFHIWGDDNGACTGSDQCADTPNQANSSGGSFPQGSIQTDACSPSSPGYMWMNYMDYTDDNAMYMFTAQQVARMEAVVNNAPWNILATSLACTPVSALDAGIISILNPIAGSATCSNSVTPRITLNNSGSTTFTTATILYRMDALATQTLNWTGSLASGTSTVLTLNNYTGLANGAHTFSASVINPNGTADGNSANNSITSTYSVIAVPVGAALPFVERFDAVTFPPTGWVQINTNTLDAAYRWTRLANATGIPVAPTTTACAKMDNFAGAIDISGQKDALRTPALNLTGANSSLRLVFDRSHRRYSNVDIDSLNIYISTDCGGTWTQLYTRGGTQLATVAATLTTAYTPTANAQWARDSVSLSAYVGQPSVYIKFESRSGWGNNLYLDNINVKFTAAAAPPVASFSVAATRCVGSSIAFTDASTNLPTSWTWTFPGSSTPTSTLQSPTITYTAAGTYTITHTAANTSGTSTAVSQTISVSANPIVSATNVSVCPGSAANFTATGASTYSWSTGALTASISTTPTVNTTYTVVGTNSVGCVNSRTVTATMRATPTVAATSKTICIGAVASLTATGATTYSWNTGATTSSISVTPTVATNYTVVGTNTLGCTNTKTLSVTVNALPNVASTSATICAGSTGTLTASGASTYSWSTGAATANLTASPGSNTTYTVTGTSTLGCVKTATAAITVGAAPSIAVSSATTCAGSPITLTASGVTTYTWNTSSNSSSITVSPTSTTVYTVTGNLTGCAVAANQTATVSVNALPTVSLAPIAGPLCVSNATVGLVGTPAGGTYSGTGVSGASFNPTIAGAGTFTITYSYTDANTCNAISTKTVNVSLCTGIVELSNSFISVYPNPANDAINVKMDGSLINHATIELYDAIGKLITTETVLNINTVLDIRSLAKGIYTIRIVSEGANVSQRIIKE